MMDAETFPTNICILELQEAWLNTLVAVEVGCWFFIGECIGKGSLVAYKVNDTTARNTH